MGWTYDPKLTATKDQVRFLIQDTDKTDQLLVDEEINYLLTIEPNAYMAAAKACSTLAASFARKATIKEVGPLKLEYGDRAQRYRDMAAEFTQQAQSTAVPVPYAGGISLSEKQTDRSDTDLNQPHFRVGFMDTPGTSDDAEQVGDANQWSGVIFP